jgi:tetratricopeptide (TPR) repeat protein
MDAGMVFRAVRIYKNGVKFTGAVHEHADCKAIKFFPDFLIKHDRLGTQSIPAQIERDKQRDEMVPKIMEAEFKKDKKNTRAAFHLALHYQARGQNKTAIRWWKRYLKHSKVEGGRWYAYYNIALCHLSSKHLFRAFWATAKANDETPDRWEIYKLRGMIFFARGHFGRAINNLIDSFKINIGDQTFKPLKHEDISTWNLIGECFFNLKKYYQAGVAFEKASEEVKDEKFKTLLKQRAALMEEMAKADR